MRHDVVVDGAPRLASARVAAHRSPPPPPERAERRREALGSSHVQRAVEGSPRVADGAAREPVDLEPRRRQQERLWRLEQHREERHRCHFWRCFTRPPTLDGSTETDAEQDNCRVDEQLLADVLRLLHHG